MEKLQKSETESSLQSVENDSDDLELLLLQLQKYLQLDSDNFERDLQEIEKFVEDLRAQFGRPERSLSLTGGVT